ncbi:MAG TPA: CPBP family intramembrane glutamic endopeptidase [Thermoanaerobaculia bacterium]|nr:CPBP family intramembrane glutamic endopeptidase [Thermoanaerobaculia bacterium]
MTGWPAIVFFLITGLVIPILAWISKRALDTGLVVPRIPFYLESGALQVLMLPFAVWVGLRSGIAIPLRGGFAIDDLLAGTALLVVALVAMFVSLPRMSKERRTRLEQIVPRTRSERMLWLAVSTAAAFNEEITYRGVMPALLLLMIDPWWVAAVVSSILFGLAHLVQGFTSTLIIMVFGFAFHLLVLFTGTLWIAIAVHLLYDLIAGYSLGRPAERL